MSRLTLLKPMTYILYILSVLDQRQPLIVLKDVSRLRDVIHIVLKSEEFKASHLRQDFVAVVGTVAEK